MENNLIFDVTQKQPQGVGSRSPIPMKKMLALLLDCLKLPKNLIDLMAGAMLSESYCAFVVIMKGLGIINTIPDWPPEVYRDKRHNFVTAMLASGFALLL